jgi:hypothetical protein
MRLAGFSLNIFKELFNSMSLEAENCGTGGAET